MSLLVVKFGGTSLGSLERIAAVAQIIANLIARQHQVVAVVSAMGGETDRLLQLADMISAQGNRRERDVILASGEQVSAALLALALEHQQHCKARSFSGWQVPIETDAHHSRARIEKISDTKLKAVLRQGYIPVIAGFQGMDRQHNVTTLGRGGSDTTAVAIAAALKADECQIYTDVDGVYTTDPRIEARARRLERITIEEMLEMASLGSKVLQIRAVEFAARYRVPLRVLSSFSPDHGTLIIHQGDALMEQTMVTAVTAQRDEAALTIRGIPDTPGIAAQILSAISDAQIVVDMIVQSVSSNRTTDCSFTVPREDYIHARAILEQLCNTLQANTVIGDTEVAKISIIGLGMRSHAGVASRMFSLLAEEGINIRLISTSEIKVSVIIEEKYRELAVRILHAGFALDMPQSS